jgi:hypothetical protein
MILPMWNSIQSLPSHAQVSGISVLLLEILVDFANLKVSRKGIAMRVCGAESIIFD